MLQGVVDPNKNGTGRSLRVTNVDVAAKTGSAEIGKDKTRMYSWFAGFRLNVAQEDERVVIVMLDVRDSGAYSSVFGFGGCGSFADKQQHCGEHHCRGCKPHIESVCRKKRKSI